MSAPTPPRAVKCLVQRKLSVDFAGLLAHGNLGHHTCSEPHSHDGDHKCGGVTGCGLIWPRAQ